MAVFDFYESTPVDDFRYFLEDLKLQENLSYVLYFLFTWEIMMDNILIYFPNKSCNSKEKN